MKTTQQPQEQTTTQTTPTTTPTGTGWTPTWPFVRPLAAAVVAGVLVGGIAAPSMADTLRVQPTRFDIVGHVAATKPGGTVDLAGTAATNRMKDWPYGPGCRSHGKKGVPEAPRLLGVVSRGHSGGGFP